MREAGVAVRPALDLARQEIIRRARLADRGRSVGLALHARSGEAEDRAIDAGAVHRREPLLAEVGQAGHHLTQNLGIDVPDRGPPVILEAGAQEMLFERNLLDHSDSAAASFFWRLMYCMLAVPYTTSVASSGAGSAEEVARGQENSRREIRGEPQQRDGAGVFQPVQ